VQYVAVSEMDKCLAILKNSQSDNEKFAALLLVSDTMKAFI
jgi:hypothetical protein